mgnify:CR=1 FL=1
MFQSPTLRGSSPHTRGAREGLRQRGEDLGIIPAYAGSTTPPTRSRSKLEDHPRIRGEHIVGSIGMVIGWGSSPHTRGALRKVNVISVARRIIPAYAGSTRDGTGATIAAADHPRIRGEHDPVGVGDGWVGGSSPHTRGAPGRGPASLCLPRIIPAYAGSTAATGSPPAASWDHPRIRGEHRMGWAFAVRALGSSPHTRGAPWSFAGSWYLCRIIPAYAGSTGFPAGVDHALGDHPRIRGEHAATSHGATAAAWIIPAYAGSTAVFADQVAKTKWIIPAYAGSTKLTIAGLDGKRDHPRIRGEHRKGGKSLTINKGSSPHTRGAPTSTASTLRWRRIIPAYAGSTKIAQKGKGMAADHPRIRGEHPRST